jgi:hypothetical protein
MSGKRTVKFEAKKKGKVEDRLGAGGKGLPIPKNANQIALAAGPDATDRKNLSTIPLRSKEAVDEQFPTAGQQSEDKEDILLAEKMELQAEGMRQQKAANPNATPVPGVTPFGILQASESDFVRLQKIREKELELQFEQWFASNYDKMGPEQKALARKLYYKFYQDRLHNADTNMDLIAKLVKLKITGPKDRDDLLLLFAAETGLIDTNYAENILHPERAARAQDKAARQNNFNRGLFSQRRLLRGDWGGDKRENNSMGFTGRNTAAPGATFGVGDNPFSAAGPGLTARTEQNSNFANTLKMLSLDEQD